MKIQPIDKFGTKLMVSSQSVNKIPYHYLSYSQNLRIYDGGIGARKGKVSVYEGGVGTNQGGFSMNGNLYQVEGGKIWRLDNSTRTEVVSLGYDARCDFLVYQNTKSDFVSLATQTTTYDTLVEPIYGQYIAREQRISITNVNGEPNFSIQLTTNNVTRPVPAIRIVKAGSPGISFRTPPGRNDGTGIILENLGQISFNGFSIDGNIEIQIGYYDTKEVCIIASDNRNIQVFNGTTLTSITVGNTGILEYFAGRSFLANANVLLASQPITLANPERAYNWSSTGSYQVAYNSRIEGLVSTLGGLYILTQDTVEYIGSEGSSSGLSIPLGEGANPINSFCVVSSGERVFYITKDLTINTINFIPGINDAQVGELTAVPVVNMKEFVKNLDDNQPMAFAFNNDAEGTIHFHLRTAGAGYNDVTLVYDLINDTYNIDTARYYNYIVKHKERYFGYSDINASVYEDNKGTLDAGSPIISKGITQNMNFGTPNQKMFQGFYTAGAIAGNNTIEFVAKIDEEEVFRETLRGQNAIGGGIGGYEVGTEIGGQNIPNPLLPFSIQADEGRIYLAGDRIQYEFSSETNEWIIDTMGTRMTMTNFVPIQNTF